MHILEAIFLGFVQGLTEFLPVSSSAHLRIVGLFLPDAQDPGAAFTAVTQLGTETAVLIYFWKDITRIVGRWFRSLSGRTVPRNDPDARLGWLVILGTIPIGVAGLLLKDSIETTFRSLWIVAIVLIGFGIVLGVLDVVGKKARRIEHMTFGGGLLIGVAQMLALVPGVSRAGATVSMGLALGYTRPAAARFAFLLAVPAVFLSGLYEAATSLGDSGAPFGLVDTLVATVVAFVVGFVVIAAFMNYISKRSFLPFVVYRIALGIVLIVLLSLGVIQP
ncbi:undecaprenyl-diphosphatase [Curtobacterium luteum]|uniref:Undecaprenyl-diphosphatase n=1 Tax=Curtobacterium luteum TaxID=33881 RepID=A0A8H9KZK5_9MICO|nr:undecaprenyl-diphosphate phosphatase [Curtobacterium luteum]MBM7801655.1 undecaprenyl-diphosphatase [Curtobacterium luteum]NUU52023.1 undecaprenyl-diphosphate phosphatase [Curtobacterium luteum]GGK88771.1 undecaprenyl-diphosphatase 2 [Curtobacterium luteum]